LSTDKKKEKCLEPIPTGNFIFSASGIVLFFGTMLVDNVSLPIRHSLQASSSRAILVLQFPPFKSSLFFNPSIGLAELLGEGGKPSSSDEALIIGVAVGGSTLLLVLGVLLLIMEQLIQS